MNVKKIICVAKMFVITSRTCVVCPLRKCVDYLHDNSKSTMAAIVNKVYSTSIATTLFSLLKVLRFHNPSLD